MVYSYSSLLLLITLIITIKTIIMITIIVINDFLL